MTKNHIVYTTDRTDFTNLRELIEWAGEQYADRLAYSYREKASAKEKIEISFQKLCADVRALASKLRAMDLAGKHLALIGKLTYEWVVTYFAAMAAGAVLVPLDRDWQAEELLDTVKKANCSCLFADRDLMDKVAVIADGAFLTAPPVFLGTKEEKHSVFSYLEEGRALFEEAPDLYFSAPINPMKTSLLVFTSGTTGKGKGVMLTQNALLSDMAAVIHYLDYGKKTVGVLPPHHTYGSTVMFIAHAMIGSEIYLSSGNRYITRELSEECPEHLVLVPLYLETFYRKILASLKEKGKYELVMKTMKLSNALRKVGIDQRRKFFSAIHDVFGGKVKTVISGGAPLSGEILDFFDGIGIPVLNGYGITECSPLISVNRSKHTVPGSVGDPIDCVSVLIDEPNEEGEGEILVKGPNVMLGYYNDDVATAEAFKNGYFRTGDYGKIDRHGVLYITGRKKNLIILSNGKNVYPEEIESELSSVPGILDIVVYEGQSRRGISYNAIVAEVYPDYEYMTKNGIEDVNAYLKPYIDSFNKKTVPYKKIAFVKVRKEEFPKNTLRKIQRFKLCTEID